ncbi:VOC family protein [Microbacterium enclense]|uniref:VOC family protein n=1 Tax=Microbacterium enclense TaxID=993073 RepID=UPI003D74F6F8
MQPSPIAHIGILVADLETSRERWAKVLAGTFSPITRYRPENWSDRGNPTPHLHDARLTFYLGDAPSIEILEFVGNGTHSPDKGEGGHHLSFPPLEDNSRRREELAELGIGIDGEIRHDGRWIFQFAEAEALNNVYTEWVEEHPDHPDVKDDLSPINRMPDGTKTLFDLETIRSLPAGRPSSRIVEIGVEVRDVSAARVRWETVTRYDFTPDRDGSYVGGVAPALIRLFASTPSSREGLAYAVIETDDLSATAERLEASDIPFRAMEENGRTVGGTTIAVDREYLNGFELRFVSVSPPWHGQ